MFFFSIPAIFLTLGSKNILRPFVFAAIVSSTIGLLVDYMGAVAHAWYTVQTIFPVRIFNIIPFENPLWSFLYFYTILITYEYFWGEKIKSMGRGILFMSLFIALAFLIYLSINAFNPKLIAQVRYFYLLFGTIFFAIPTGIYLLINKKGFNKLLLVALYIIPLGFIDEVTSVLLHYWEYPGKELIAWINIFNVKFPVEELIFFVILSPFAILSYYKFINEIET